MLRMILSTTVVLCVLAGAAVAAEAVKTVAPRSVPVAPRARVFRGEAGDVAGVPMAQRSTFRAPPVPSRTDVVAAPVPMTHTHAALPQSVDTDTVPGMEARCSQCGKPFVYHPVIKPYFQGEGAPSPIEPPDAYKELVNEKDFEDFASMGFRERYQARGTSKPVPFNEGPYGHLSRYAQTWDPNQMVCEECLAQLRGKLAGKTPFTAAPTRPGIAGFGVVGGIRTIFMPGPEGERFYYTKTFFDEAEDPPYWPRQYKVEPIYHVPNYNPQTYVVPYQFPQSRHQGQAVPTLRTYKR